MDNLGELMAQVKQMQASMNTPTHRTRPGGSVQEQVLSRLHVARIGTMQLQIGMSLTGGSIKSAPPENPPIQGGMTDTMKRIKDIVLKQGDPSVSELKQIPDLMKHIRHLLRVYYDTVVSGKKTSEFKLCDVQSIYDIGLDLHEVGLFLQLHPTRLKSLLKVAPSFETFVIEEPIDVGQWRLRADAIKKRIEADVESNDEDREMHGEMESKTDKDFAAYQMAYFYGDVLVALVMDEGTEYSDNQRVDRAMKKLVEISTVPFWRLALGDALTDAMRPVYWTPKLLMRFAHSGGLPALIGDWAISAAKEGICQQAVERLPKAAWDHQTEESLLGVMRELIGKIEADGPDFFTSPIFTNMMHQIYSRYGLAPFERATTISSQEIVFYYIFKRLSKKPQKFQSAKEWARFLERYSKVPRSTNRRHSWSIMTVSGRWDCLTYDYYGCDFEGCPERAALQKLNQRRVRGLRDAVVEDRLYRFGADSKACNQCKHVSYCGRECQVADWPKHKQTCKVEAAKGKNEDI